MKQSDLVMGQEYHIKYTGKFCNNYNQDGSNHKVFNDYPNIKAIFVGTININVFKNSVESRNIFYSIQHGYFMFSAKEIIVDYIVNKDEVLTKIKELEDKISELKKLV